jgi:ABC-type lipoprotein export system ATPase subunit
MKIEIRNCNNIDSGEISIEENILNIKYAINGTGKSSISKAILYKSNDINQGTSTLQFLKPFKYQDDKTALSEISGIDKFKTVKMFSDEYINEYIFKEDELIKGSFDIFVKNADYDKGLKEIDDLVQEIKNILKNDKEIEVLKNDFGAMINAFGRDAKNGLHGSSLLAKAFKDGNKVENIPAGLEVYSDYIKSPENYKWIKWQMEGKSFIDLTENCPYCVSNIKEKKETIKKVSESYDSKTIENMNKIVSVFQELNAYFSNETKNIIDKFVKNIDGYTTDQVNFLKEVKVQIENLRSKFENAQNIGFYSLKDVDKVVDGLKEYYIDLTLYNHLKSDKTKEKVDIVNNALDEIAKKAGLLQGCIKKQQRLIENIVNSNKQEINSFLHNAGYKYSVDLVEENDGIRKLKLVFNDTKNQITNAKTHLSFGEKNAISLILFMYDALRLKSDLIILDDPISSFDKNKKYAIIDMLFKKEKFLKGKTVLMLTHDIDPLVDIMLVHGSRFDKPSSAFLENNNGVLSEKEITRENIKTFIDICNENMSSSQSKLTKLVYFRRLLELTNKDSLGYQLVSNLFHKRDVPEIHKNQTTINMTQEEIRKGEAEIKEKINEDFSYTDSLSVVLDNAKMIEFYHQSQSNYEKLHFYRVIFDDKDLTSTSDVIKKFINESFHIENNYIYQLNPCEYQVVPQYIIEECDKHIKELEEES